MNIQFPINQKVFIVMTVRVSVVACVCVCPEQRSIVFVHLFNYLAFFFAGKEVRLHAAKTLAISLNNVITYDNFSLSHSFEHKAFRRQPGINNTK